ncbi:MAG: DUF3631 domain-containing protein [Gemmatimonadaceae bacterium]|nr:DUF3631 domain-containing protein [Gemmatimonadaceae bacterium]
MTGPTLVAAVIDIMGDRRSVSTRDLLAALEARGTALDPRALARALRPYGVRPRTVRLPGASATPKGYCRDSFGPGGPSRRAADDPGDLSIVERDDGSIAKALPAKLCRCASPVADDGDCFRCGHSIAGLTR